MKSEYRIIHVQGIFSLGNVIEKLERAVAEAIDQGWEPLGGVSISETSLCQAMWRKR